MANLDIPTTNRYKLLMLLGGKCRMCEETRPQHLELDHIYNDGDLERTKYGSSEKIWHYYLINELLAFKRIQPLCKMHHNEKHNPIPSLEPNPETTKMIKFMGSLKFLEGENKIPVSETMFIRCLVESGDFDESQARHYIKRMLREANIYESKIGHYNRV